LGCWMRDRRAIPAPPGASTPGCPAPPVPTARVSSSSRLQPLRERGVCRRRVLVPPPAELALLQARDMSDVPDEPIAIEPATAFEERQHFEPVAQVVGRPHEPRRVLLLRLVVMHQRRGAEDAAPEVKGAQPHLPVGDVDERLIEPAVLLVEPPPDHDA